VFSIRRFTTQIQGKYIICLVLGLWVIALLGIKYCVKLKQENKLNSLSINVKHTRLYYRKALILGLIALIRFIRPYIVAINYMVNKDIILRGSKSKILTTGNMFNLQSYAPIYIRLMFGLAVSAYLIHFYLKFNLKELSTLYILRAIGFCVCYMQLQIYDFVNDLNFEGNKALKSAIRRSMSLL